MNNHVNMKRFSPPQLDDETVGDGPVFTTRMTSSADRPDLGRFIKEIEITEYNKALQKIRTHTRIVSIVSSG